MNQNNLILITSSYPFGNGETFIENEIEYLAKHFQKIIIISHNISVPISRKTPANVITERYSQSFNTAQKLKSFQYIFSDILQQEITFLKQTLSIKFNFFKLKTALFSLSKAYQFKKYLDSIVLKHKLDNQKDVYYSYWMNDNSMALALDATIQKKICK